MSLRQNLSLFTAISSGCLWRLPRCCQGGAEGGRQPVCFLCPAGHYCTGYPCPRCLLWRKGPQATIDQGPSGIIHSSWHDWVSANIPVDTDLPSAYGRSDACTVQVRLGVRTHVSPLRPFISRGAHKSFAILNFAQAFISASGRGTLPDLQPQASDFPLTTGSTLRC
jgi:hypothetical protein